MLSRNELINIMKENEINISRDNTDLYVIKNILESILKKLNSVVCVSDSRFIPYGRMETIAMEKD